MLLVGGMNQANNDRFEFEPEEEIPESKPDRRPFEVLAGSLTSTYR